MSRSAPAGGFALRLLILILLAAGPPLAGAVHEPVFIPLLIGCAVAGVAAWWRSRRRPDPVPALPGARLLLALHAVVLLQLVPLPMGVLRLVSPGSHAYYDHVLLDPAAAWRPISVSPPDTLRGLAFLVCFSLLAFAVFHEMGERPWRRRLLWTIVGVGLLITVTALVQSVSSTPHRVYGLWQPRWDWAVFGPYVNQSHFAGYLLMATPLALGFAIERLAQLGRAWRRKRHGFLALGDREGNAAIRIAAIVVVLVAGLLAAGSRGAVGALFVVMFVLPLVGRQRRRTLLVVLLLIGLGVALIGLGGFLSALESRGIRRSRVDLWADMLPMFPRFPLFGVGLNAFSTAYPAYQTVAKVGPDWVGEAHNEYLQVLLDTGLAGAAVVAAILAIVFARALVRARASPIDLGLFGALFGVSLHNLVDFNWQIPANAATWVALAAVACRKGADGNTHERP